VKRDFLNIRLFDRELIELEIGREYLIYDLHHRCSECLYLIEICRETFGDSFFSLLHTDLITSCEAIHLLRSKWESLLCDLIRISQPIESRSDQTIGKCHISWESGFIHRTPESCIKYSILFGLSIF
jgi:hypothetical protein